MVKYKKILQSDHCDTGAYLRGAAQENSIFVSNRSFSAYRGLTMAVLQKSLIKVS